MKSSSSIELKGESKYNIRKIVLDNGIVIDLSDSHLTYILICKENGGDGFSNFNVSYSMNSRADCIALSNQCLLMSNAIKFMDKHGVDFETAAQMHIKLIEDCLKQKETKQ